MQFKGNLSLQRIATKASFAETAEKRVDREAGIIRGYAVISRGEALGHDSWVDDVTLKQTVALGEKRVTVKSRFTHPGMCSDGMGSQLGRTRDFRLDGDVVRGDFHAHLNLTSDMLIEKLNCVYDLAENAPQDFGASIVFAQDAEAMRAFMKANLDSTGAFKSPDPKNVKNFPHVRLSELRACDIVDEPAANEGGFFNEGGENAAFGEAVLNWLTGVSSTVPSSFSLGGMEPARVQNFYNSYLQRHGLRIVKETLMSKKLASETEPEKPAEKKPEMAEGQECPDCKKSSPADAAYCAYCGSKFADPEDGEGLEEDPDAPEVKKDVTKASAKKTFSKAELDKAVADAETKQQTYATRFKGIMAAAGFEAVQRESFREEYYGNEISIVQKFANILIEKRTVAAGENGAVAADGSQQEAEELSEATARFRAKRAIREQFGVYTDDEKSDAWKKGLSEYAAGLKKAERHFKK